MNLRHQPRRKSSSSVSSILLELSTDTGYNSCSNTDNDNDNDKVFGDEYEPKVVRENSLTLSDIVNSEDDDNSENTEGMINNNNNNNNNNNYNNNNNNNEEEEDRDTIETKYEEHIKWMLEDNDYISMETVTSLQNFEVLLDVIIRCGCPMGLSVRVGHLGKGFTVLLHLIQDFKKDFMVVRIGEKHCLFMEPF